MKKLVRTMATSGLVLACAALFGTTNVHAQNEANTLTNKEKADGWELLFDGQTMNGWRDYNGTKLTGAWEAKDDCIQYKDGQ